MDDFTPRALLLSENLNEISTVIKNEDDTVNSKKRTESRGLDSLNIQKIDGVNYLTFALGPDLVHLRNLARGISIREDDVITVGFPRSGNHWTFEIVSMILSQTTEFEKDHFYSRLIECLGSEVMDRVGKMKSPRNLTTHNKIHFIPHQAIEKKTKVIYVMRNPKDVWVSLYKFTSNLVHPGSAFRGSWTDFFDLQMRGEFPWGYWFDHVLATELFQKNHPECAVFILVYEKLKQEPVAQIRRLCRFLNKSEFLAEQISESTQFSHMKSVLSSTKLAVQSINHFKNGPDDILRKGVIGDWKNWFTVSQNEAFNLLFDKKMEGSQLGDIIRPYI